MRTTRNTVSFTRPFKLRGMDHQHPAGDYVVDTDEEPIGILSKMAYRRVATLIHLPLVAHGANSIEVVEIQADELAAALDRDQAAGPIFWKDRAACVLI